MRRLIRDAANCSCVMADTQAIAAKAYNCQSPSTFTARFLKSGGIAGGHATQVLETETPPWVTVIGLAAPF